MTNSPVNWVDAWGLEKAGKDDTYSDIYWDAFWQEELDYLLDYGDVAADIFSNIYNSVFTNPNQDPLHVADDSLEGLGLLGAGLIALGANLPTGELVGGAVLIPAVVSEVMIIGGFIIVVVAGTGYAAGSLWYDMMPPEKYQQLNNNLFSPRRESK